MIGRIRFGELVSEGHWLIADRQNAGRGRQGRVWQDAEGNFLGSTVVALRPHDPPAHCLAFFAGLLVYKTVAHMIDDAASLQLKWPNDVLLNGAKLAGILLERESDAVVIGIGVNLAFAPTIADRKTTSLAAVGHNISRDSFAARLSEQLPLLLSEYRLHGFAGIREEWIKCAHPIGTSLRVQEGDTLLLGSFDGLDKDGALMLRLANGAIRAIHAADVFLV